MHKLHIDRINLILLLATITLLLTSCSTRKEIHYIIDEGVPVNEEYNFKLNNKELYIKSVDNKEKYHYNFKDNEFYLTYKLRF